MKKLIKAEIVEKFPLYDITVKDDHCFELANGVIAHNSKAVVSGGCLEPGTKIQMADGTFKNIEDVLENDLVSTLDGPKPVTNIWNPETLDEGEPECIEIEFEDGIKVVCSESHRFLVKDEWIEAKDLNIKNILLAASLIAKL